MSWAEHKSIFGHFFPTDVDFFSFLAELVMMETFFRIVCQRVPLLV
jgi:hypothetical protein